MDGDQFGAWSSAWLHSETGLRRLGLWSPEGLSACGMAANPLLGSGAPLPLTASAANVTTTPAEFRRELAARRKRDATVTSSIAQAAAIDLARKLARVRAEVAALRASAAASSELTADESAQIRERIKQELRDRMTG